MNRSKRVVKLFLLPKKKKKKYFPFYSKLWRTPYPKENIQLSKLQVGIFLFKLNNRKSRAMWEINSKLTTKTLDQRHGFFIVNFEQIPFIVDVCIVNIQHVNTSWDRTLTLYAPTPIKWSNTLKQFVDCCPRIVWVYLSILWG